MFENSYIDRIEGALDLYEIWLNYAGGRQIGICHKNSDEDYIAMVIPKNKTKINSSHISIQSAQFDLCARNLWTLLDDYSMELRNRLEYGEEQSFNVNSYLIYLYLMAPKVRVNQKYFNCIQLLLKNCFCPQIAFDFFTDKANIGYQKMNQFKGEVNVRELLFLIRNVLAKRSLIKWPDSIPSTVIVDMLNTKVVSDDIETIIKDLINEYLNQDTNLFKREIPLFLSEWVQEGVALNLSYEINYDGLLYSLDTGKKDLILSF